MAERRKVGIIVAPRYFDTTYLELLEIAPDIEVMQTQIRVESDFAFDLDQIVATAPEVEACARSLAEAGVDIVLQLGTPFSTAHGWHAGSALATRIESEIGVPFEMMGLSVPIAATALSATRVALATSYYSPQWVERYTRFLADAGLQVVGGESFVDQGLFPTHDDAFEASFAGFEADVIIRSIEQVAQRHPDAECIVVPGLPCRFLHAVAALEGNIEKPVVSYYAIWWRCLTRLGLGANNRLGRLFSLPPD